MNKYFAIEQKEKSADINIYGDITSWPWLASDVSSYNLSKRLDELKDCDEINVYINSYGGEVSEGLAIYNALKRSKAKVKTVCDGFACSIASVIFMAGDERIMNNASLLMIHNASTSVWDGTPQDFKKAAEDLEIITSASKKAYLEHINITEEELTALMDAETWLTPEKALEMGFVTEIVGEKLDNKASQSVRAKVMQMFADKPIEVERIPEVNLDDLTQKIVDGIMSRLKETSKQSEMPFNGWKTLFKF